jgi:hypothetical protein
MPPSALHTNIRNSINQSVEQYGHALNVTSKNYAVLVAGHAQDASRRTKNAISAKETRATSPTLRISPSALHSNKNNSSNKSVEQHRHASDVANKSYAVLVAGHA